MNNILDLAFLFIISLLAATILPAQSEIVLVGLNFKSDISSYVLLVVATFGNVLGSVINWFLGRYLRHFKGKKYFPIKEKSLTKATDIYNKYGVWTLLLAWVPFIGDPLTIVAGILRTNIIVFLILVTIGKMGRYAAILSVL